MLRSTMFVLCLVTLLVATFTPVSATEIYRSDLKSWSGAQAIYMHIGKGYAFDITGFLPTANRSVGAEIDAGPTFTVGDGNIMVAPMIGVDFAQDKGKINFGEVYPQIFAFRTTKTIHYETWNVGGWDPNTGNWMLSERLLLTKPVGNSGFWLGAQGDADFASHTTSRFVVGPLAEFKVGDMTFDGTVEFGKETSRFLFNVAIVK